MSGRSRLGRGSYPSRPMLRYHGGKYRLAPWIIAHFGPHRTYVEPYGGAGSVLLQKPRSYAEVINDLDGDVVNLFQVLRDPASAKDLTNLLRLTPFARDEFARAYAEGGDAIERARRLIVRSFMGFGSAAANPAHITGFRADSRRSGTTPSHDWVNYPDALSAFTRRLQGVVIENRPAVRVLQSHDSDAVLHYVDPPYVLSTRYAAKQGRKNNCYRYEMTDDDHRELARVLRSLQGAVFLSGYACPLYDEELYPDWARETEIAFIDGAKKRTECLWMNAAAVRGLPQKGLKL